MSLKETTKENSFDDEYTEMKVSNESYFKASIEAIAVPLGVRVTNHRSVGDDNSERVVDINRFAQKEHMRQQNHHYGSRETLVGYEATPCLALDLATEDTLQFVSLDAEELIEFIEFPDGLEGTPQLKESCDTLELKLNGDSCEIRSIGECDITTMHTRWLSLSEVFSHSEELEQRREDASETQQRVIKNQQRHLGNALTELLNDLRRSWAKANDCYATIATVEQVSPNDDSNRPSADLKVMLPEVDEQLSFTVYQPGKWDEDHPVIQFVEQVGHGQITGAELEDCFVTFDRHKGKAVAKSDSGMYLYAEDPTETESSDGFFRDMANGFKTFFTAFY